MRNIKKIMLSAVVCAITALMAVTGCSIDADGSAVSLSGTTLINGKLSIDENSRIAQFSLKFSDDATVTYRTYVGNVGTVAEKNALLKGATEATSGSKISIADQDQKVLIYYKDSEVEDIFEYEFKSNDYSGFTTPESLGNSKSFQGMVLCPGNNGKLWYKITTGATVRYLFTQASGDENVPDDTTGIAITASFGKIAVDANYMLISVWNPGVNPASAAPNYTGRYEIPAKAGTVGTPECRRSDGFNLTSGATTTLRNGESLEFRILSAKADKIWVVSDFVSGPVSQMGAGACFDKVDTDGYIRAYVPYTARNETVWYKAYAEKAGKYSDQIIIAVQANWSTTTTVTTPTDTTATTTPKVTVVTYGYLKLDETYKNCSVQITFEDEDKRKEIAKVDSTGKLPIIVKWGDKISVSVILENGQWVGPRGFADEYGQADSSCWNKSTNKVTLRGYYNKTPNRSEHDVDWEFIPE